MAKNGKLTKIKSVLKKWQSFGKLSRSNSSIAAANNSSDEDSSSSFDNGRELLPVYVGKTRRRYLVTSEVFDHPVFRELMERSADDDDDATTIFVGCEVVLFEHLLWMLENGDPQPESLDELVDYYAW